MAFFDELGKKITETSQGAIQKTKDMANVGKINDLIKNEERRINSCFINIGQQYFELYNGRTDDPFIQQMNEVINAQCQIKKYQEEIKLIKGVTNCDNCGAEVQHGAQFCSTCGNVMNKQSPLNAESHLACANCGIPLSADAMFCTACGTKVENASVSIDYQPQEVSQNMHCPDCGKELPAEAVFCTECGRKMEE